MTKPCPNCGSANVETNKFCSNCGTTLQSVAASPTADVPPEDQAPFSGPTIPWAPPATSYVVKTTADDEAATGDPDVPPRYMSTFVPPPAPASSDTQYFASDNTAASGPPTGYQGYTPGASSRKEGAAYMPYSAGTAAAIEKPKESRSFLMPIIVGAGVVLVALAIFSGWLVANSGSNKSPVAAGKSPSPVPTSAAQATKVPANAPEEDKVKEVIRTSNDEQIKAWRDLDANILKGTRTGKVLDEQVGMVEDLKKGHMYAIPVNVELSYLDVKVTGDTATVRTKEIW